MLAMILYYLKTCSTLLFPTTLLLASFCVTRHIRGFRNEILAACQPGKKLYVEVILISEFMNSDKKSFLQKSDEVFLISEFIYSEIRITSTFRFILPGCQDFISKNLC